MKSVIPIRVAVSATESVALSVKSIELATRDYADSLLADLDLAVSLDVAVTPVAAGIVPAGRFRMTIGNEDLFVCQSDQKFEEQIPLALYRQRGMLITDDTVQAIAASAWPDAVVTEYTVIKLHDLLRACVDRNVSLRRLAPLLATVQPSELWDTWDLLYRIHCEKDLCVGIELAPPDFALSNIGDSDWVSAQTDVFRATGLLCPAPRVMHRAELAANEWRIRINDVRLPPQRLGEVEDAARECVERLSNDAHLFVTRDGVERSLRLVAQSAPVLAEEVVRRLGLNRLVWILGLLAREGTPLRSFHQILDDLTGTIVPYEVEQDTFTIIRAPLDTLVRRKPGEGRRELTPEDYVSAIHGLRR